MTTAWLRTHARGSARDSARGADNSPSTCRSLDMASRLAPLLAVAVAATAAAAANVTLLVEAHDPRTWFGSVAISLAAADDPLLMVVSGVAGGR